MESRTIKVSGEIYRWLARLAAELQKENGFSVSFDEALRALKSGRSGKNALLNVAGSWKKSGAEIEEIERKNRDLWKTWKLHSV